MNDDSPFECVIAQGNRLGECPRWDGHSQWLYWVDITGRRLHRLAPDGGGHDALVIDEDIGCFARHADGGFIAGLRSGIWRLDENGAKTARLASNPEDQRVSRFNDGRADSAGRFWLGTVDESKSRAAGLYCLDHDGLKQIAGGLLTSNGLAFSPNENAMYHSDTPRFVVYRYPFDHSEGVVGERQEWVRLTPTAENRGRPDGAAVDVEGRYWSALYEGGAVACFSPTGEFLASYPVPARCPTMCAFGGRDLKTLYVTSARDGRPRNELDRYPLAGGLFAMRVATPGLPEPPCRV